MPTIMSTKSTSAPSVFQPTALLREARRQKGITSAEVPSVCILDPDGDIVRRLRQIGKARPYAYWPCYHTDLDTFELSNQTVGIIGRAVGAPFAVLVAEELFASGCQFLLSITSAGQIARSGPTPYFVLIDRALRDEGTSHHYAPPTEYAHADVALISKAAAELGNLDARFFVGATWTTDAPFRETADAIEWARSKGVMAVEMEAAALYAFAEAAGVKVLCIAHVTNDLGQAAGDFEKGENEGTTDALLVLNVLAGILEPKMP